MLGMLEAVTIGEWQPSHHTLSSTRRNVRPAPCPPFPAPQPTYIHRALQQHASLSLLVKKQNKTDFLEEEGRTAEELFSDLKAGG